ncbi:MAG: hypothetical protein WAO20_10100 [Acidobacteriota bacterium]
MRMGIGGLRLRVGLSVTGLVGLAMAVGALVLVERLEPKLTVAGAERRIELYYETRFARQHLAELEAQGRRLPDLPTARLWQAELNRIRGLRFSGTEVKRPWIDRLSDLPNHLVRTRIRDGSGEEAWHYFWISATHFDRELPTWVWYVLP